MLYALDFLAELPLLLVPALQLRYLSSLLVCSLGLFVDMLLWFLDDTSLSLLTSCTLIGLLRIMDSATGAADSFSGWRLICAESPGLLAPRVKMSSFVVRLTPFVAELCCSE